MGSFDSLANVAIKKDQAGKQHYYPWANLSVGYEIETEEQKAQIYKFYNKAYGSLISLIVVGQLTMGVKSLIAILPLYGLWYYWALKKLTKGMTVSQRAYNAAAMRKRAEDKDNK